MLTHRRRTRRYDSPRAGHGPATGESWISRRSRRIRFRGFGNPGVDARSHETGRFPVRTAPRKRCTGVRRGSHRRRRSDRLGSSTDVAVYFATDGLDGLPRP